MQCACVCLCALCALHLPRQCARYQYMFSHSTPPPTRRGASGAFLCVEPPPHIAYSPSFVCCICTLIQRKKCRHPPSCFAVCCLCLRLYLCVSTTNPAFYSNTGHPTMPYCTCVSAVLLLFCYTATCNLLSLLVTWTFLTRLTFAISAVYRYHIYGFRTGCLVA